MQNKNNIPQLLNWNEAAELLKSVDSPITNQLMNRATFQVLKRVLELKEFPLADFDMKFFMEVMFAFCSDHNTLRKILDGEDLRLFSDDVFD